MAIAPPSSAHVLDRDGRMSAAWRRYFASLRQRATAGGGDGGGGAPDPHAASHETGGADAIDSLDAAVLTTGTLPDARLSATVARRDQTNTFTAEQRIAAAANVRLDLQDTSQPIDQRLFRLANAGQQLRFRAANDAASTFVDPLLLNRSGDATFGNNVTLAGQLFTQGRATALGEWVTLAYWSGYFASPLGGTWTVPSATSEITYSYVGASMAMSVYIYNSTLSGAPASTVTYLRITIPDSKVIARQARSAATLYASGAVALGTVMAVPSTSELRVQIPYGYWGNGQVDAYFQICFGIVT